MFKTIIYSFILLFSAQVGLANEISIRNSSGTCNSSSEGAIRYVSADKNFEGCDGTSWRSLGADKTVSLLSTLNLTGSTSTQTWNITGLTIGAPLIIKMGQQFNGLDIRIRVISGSNDLIGNGSNEMFSILGHSNWAYASSGGVTIIPTATTVSISVYKGGTGDADIFAYQ